MAEDPLIELLRALPPAPAEWISRAQDLASGAAGEDAQPDSDEGERSGDDVPDPLGEEYGGFGDDDRGDVGGHDDDGTDLW